MTEYSSNGPAAGNLTGETPQTPAQQAAEGPHSPAPEMPVASPYIEATATGQSASSNYDWKLFGCCSFGCLGTGTLLIVGIIIAIAVISQNLATVDPDDVKAKRYLAVNQEKNRLAVEVFHHPGAWGNLLREEVPELSERIARILELATEEDFDGVRELIDPDGFTAQMLRSGFASRISLTDRILLYRDFDRITDGPPGFQHFKIVGGYTINPEERLVYLYAWDDYDQPTEYRWWFIRRDGQWMLIDWERLRLGISEASEYAILHEHYETSGVKQYYKFMELLQLALNSHYAGETKKAESFLESADRCKVHDHLRDKARYLLGWYWNIMGDSKRGRDFLQQVVSPEHTPGTYLMLAECDSDLGNHEQVIVSADHYESKLGVRAAPGLLRAAAYETLDDPDAAIEELKNVLTVIPDCREPLNSLVRLLPGPRVSEIKPLIEATTDPQKTTMELVSGIYRKKQLPLLTMLRDIVDGQPDHEALKALIDGVRHELVFDFPAAADSFLRAARSATGEDEKSQYTTRYLQVMHSMDRIAEGYQNAPDKQFAFSYLIDPYEDEETYLEPEQALEIIDLHAGDFPDDPWLHYCRGRVCEDTGKIDEAEKEYRLAIGAETDDPESAEMAEYRLHRILAASGQSLEAYQSSKAESDAFPQIAGSLLSIEEFETLRELIDAHRSNEPDDPAIMFYEASLMLQQKDDEAVVQLLQHYELPEEKSHWRYSLDSLLYPSLVRTKGWKDHLKSASDQTEAFAGICNQLFQQDRLNELNELIDSREGLNQPFEDRLNWQIRIAESREDDEQLEELLTSLNADNWESFERWQAKHWKEKLVRVYVRNQQLDKAEALAGEVYAEQEDPDLMLLVHLARGDAAGAEPYLKELAAVPYRLSSFYENKESRKLMNEQQFEDLRRKYPEGLPYIGASEVYLLLDNDAHWDADAIEEQLRESGFDPATFVVSENLKSITGNRLLIHEDGDMRCLITPIERKLKMDDWLAPAEQIRVLDSHSKIVAITAFGNVEDDAKLARQLKIANALCNEKCVGIYFAEHTRLLNQPESQLAQVNPAKSDPFGDTGIDVWLSVTEDETKEVSGRESTDHTQLGPLAYWQRMQQLQQLLREFSESEKPTIQVRISQSTGGVTESCWFDLVEIRDAEYGDESCVCRVAEGCELLPQIQPGRHYLVQLARIMGWRNASK